MTHVTDKLISPLNCRYGAPVGRGDNGTLAHCVGETLYLMNIPLDAYDGCYDEGGAYWGWGEPLFAWINADGDRWGYLRATSRNAARQALIEGGTPDDVPIIDIERDELEQDEEA